MDAVEVVRCRECEHNKSDGPYGVTCELGFDFTEWFNEDFYCPRGQRREDGDA